MSDTGDLREGLDLCAVITQEAVVTRLLRK